MERRALRSGGDLSGRVDADECAFEWSDTGALNIATDAETEIPALLSRHPAAASRGAANLCVVQLFACHKNCGTYLQ